MNILPYQTEIAERMLINTEDETIAPDAQFVYTTNGYWIAWQPNGMAALLAPDVPDDEPCFWVEGMQNLNELVDMVQNGELDDIRDFEGDEDEWTHHECSCGCAHEHVHQP